jgi:hypothetical protein
MLFLFHVKCRWRPVPLHYLKEPPFQMCCRRFSKPSFLAFIKNTKSLLQFKQNNPALLKSSLLKPKHPAVVPQFLSCSKEKSSAYGIFLILFKPKTWRFHVI